MLRFAITAGCLLWASIAVAQFTQPNSGGSSSYGAFGARNIGGGTSAGTSGFSAGTSSSLGNRQMGSTGSSGLGASGQGTGGNNALAAGNSQMRDMQQERQQAGFVGADSADPRIAQGMQQQSQMQMNALQSVFSQFNRQNQQRNQNQNQNQQGKKQLRISIKADIPISSAASTSTSLGRQFETRLTKLPGLEKQNSVQVTMEGRTAVLSGSVASDRDRALVEGLALLEPGISSVRNELVVADAAATAEELPAPRR